MNKVSRIYGLDILRAVAILFVLFFHGNLIIKHQFEKIYSYAVPDGVTIFFVLSGFLIGGILLTEINKPVFGLNEIKSFWIRRWLRTLPAYFVVLFLLIIYRILTGFPPSLDLYLRYFTFTQNITDGDLSFFPESWSLSIEEWFYILIPICFLTSVLIFKESKKQVVLFWIIFTICFSVFMRINYGAVKHMGDLGKWNNIIRKALLTRFDSIMFGFAGAFLSYYNYKIWRKEKLLAIIGTLLLITPSINYIAFEFNWFASYLRIPFETIGTLFLLPALCNLKTGSGLLFKFFTFISTISYSLYLLNYTPFNEIILPRLYKYLGIPVTHNLSFDLLLLLCFLIWAVAASYILYRIVEKPGMDLRDRLTKK
jgi:peptidoglycan/LPS O-acetylase OafA/YrhL